MISLSVILLAYNPQSVQFGRTLAGLRAQSLPPDRWELILVDNASDPPLDDRAALAGHPAGRVVRESAAGLTHARLRGFDEARGETLVMVDDDNVLHPAYLERAVAAFAERPDAGAVGGRNLPEYEGAAPPWLEDAGGSLACRDLGPDERWASWAAGEPRTYPACSPVGAGMALRREVAERWAADVERDPVRRSLDRVGTSLASGGDNDIVLTALAAGYAVGYLPGLELTHLIPAGRLTADYHARLQRGSSRTWVKTLAAHGIRPWSPVRPATVPLRKLRAALRTRPWAGTVNRLRYAAACGQFEGRADVWRMTHRRDADGETT
jgi:glycosyltransferase involved in cell wall biosynthesis